MRRGERRHARRLDQGPGRRAEQRRRHEERRPFRLEDWVHVVADHGLRHVVVEGVRGSYYDVELRRQQGDGAAPRQSVEQLEGFPLLGGEAIRVVGRLLRGGEEALLARDAPRSSGFDGSRAEAGVAVEPVEGCVEAPRQRRHVKAGDRLVVRLLRARGRRRFRRGRAVARGRRARRRRRGGGAGLRRRRAEVLLEASSARGPQRAHPLRPHLHGPPTLTITTTTAAAAAPARRRGAKGLKSFRRHH